VDVDITEKNDVVLRDAKLLIKNARKETSNKLNPCIQMLKLN
jgi:hypothetical protein